MNAAELLAEFDGSVCPACHHRAHDPGSCSECPRCELHTDEALAFVLRYEPALVRVWDSDLTNDEITRLANAIAQSDYMNWGPNALAVMVSGTVRAIAAARIEETA